MQPKSGTSREEFRREGREGGRKGVRGERKNVWERQK
jgi:hypothetical protein